MENENLPIDWINVLTQWLFFFALLTAFFFPAFKFRNLAKKYSKNEWIYFFAGLAVGIFGFNVGKIIVFPLKQAVPQKYAMYLVSVLFFSAYLAYRFSYKYLENRFSKPN